MRTLYLKFTILFGLTSAFPGAGVIQANQYALWDIDDSKIVIPFGVLTEAALTLKADGSADAWLYVHLPDNVTYRSGEHGYDLYVSQLRMYRIRSTGITHQCSLPGLDH